MLLYQVHLLACCLGLKASVQGGGEEGVGGNRRGSALLANACVGLFWLLKHLPGLLSYCPLGHWYSRHCCYYCTYFQASIIATTSRYRQHTELAWRQLVILYA